MRKSLKYLLTLSLCCLPAALASNKPQDVYRSQSQVATMPVESELPRQHDLADIYDQGGIRQDNLALSLQPGLYEIGSLFSTSRSEYYMLVEKDISSPENTYKVMVFSKRLPRDKRSKAWILNAKPFGNGSSLMLANLKLENNRFINQDEDVFFDTNLVAKRKAGHTSNDDTPYIIIDRNNGEGKEFVLSGTHPLLASIDAGNIGMRISRKKNPRLLPPQYAFFKYRNRGRKPRHPESYLANGEKILIGQNTFHVVTINGAHGGFYALEEIKINTQSRQYASTGVISTAVAYVQGCWDEDGFIKFSPHLDGSYTATYFDEDHLDSIFERFFRWLFQ